MRRGVKRRLVALLLLGGLGAWATGPLIEAHVEARLRSEAAARGFVLNVDAVRFSWIAPFRLEGLRVERPGQGLATVGRVDVRWGLAGGADPRRHLQGLDAEAIRLERGEAVVEMPALRLQIAEWIRGPHGDQVLLRDADRGGEIDLHWRTAGPARELGVRVADVDLGTLCQVRWRGEAVVEAGRWTGTIRLESDGERAVSEGALQAGDVRVALFGGTRATPAPVRLAWHAVRERERRVLGWRGAWGGVEVAGGTTLAGSRVEAHFSGTADLAAAVRAAGLELPVAGPPAPDLGIASLEGTVSADLADLTTLEARPRLTFRPPRTPLPALAALRGPFTATLGGEILDVREGAPGFIGYGDLPPLFVRALLISEDTGFFGHPGLDVAEIPVAWASNLARGRPARGASTITQQLVKNLFLSQQKTYERKVTEAVLALLADATLSKPRILEIYVNVIEWGPHLHGLRPAAHHYFGKEPAALTPREIAFLVCLIPSPVRYHEAHTAGRLGPGMEQLVHNLLVKLRSVAALDDLALAAAEAEVLAFRPEEG